MSRKHFHTTTALGLCLAMVPLMVPLSASAQDVTGADATGFTPAIQTCLDSPDAAFCDPVRALVVECADDLQRDGCAELFADAGAVLDDPDRRAQAQETLARARDAIEQGDLASATDVAEDDTEALIVDEAEAAAEVEEVAEAEAEAEGDAAAEAEALAAEDAQAEAEAEAEADAEAELRVREALEAEERAAEAADEAPAEAWGETAEDTEAEATEGAPAEGVWAQDTATDDERADDAAAAEAAAAEAQAEAQAEATARDEERERLRAEAEAMAEEAPELIVEEASDEEFVAPDEAPSAPDAEQQTALDRLMENPEVSAAIALLGGAPTQADTDTPDEQRAGSFAAALAGLQRERGADVDADAATDDQAGEVTEQGFTADDVRSSRDDFDSRFAMDFESGQARRDDRRDLERAGLVALGALAVGMMINQNRVVARSDERVVVMSDEGEYAVWRDDDVILRQEGTQRRIERYDDGSSLSRWDRPDGSQIVTIRDATGRVLLRERILPDGTAIRMVDDMREIQPVNVANLPPPRARELRLTQRTDPDLALALLQEAEADARELDRAFSLRQIREIREVRELVPVLSPDPITFETNRANVRAEEAPKLAQVGRLMERLIASDPREVFLVEGHTDATGPASYNLALSDRRAESVALALTEFFDIPPENLIIQGYGERHLRIPTAAAEERNRRVAIRRVSPLLGL